MITKAQIVDYFEEAKRYFAPGDFPKLRFVQNDFEEKFFKQNGFSTTAEFFDDSNEIVIYIHNLKRRKLTKIFWRTMLIHELVHWHYRKMNFFNCHNRMFAAKLLRIYRKALNEKELENVLKLEKWDWLIKIKQKNCTTYDIQIYTAYEMCKYYKLL